MEEEFSPITSEKKGRSYFLLALSTTLKKLTVLCPEREEGSAMAGEREEEEIYWFLITSFSLLLPEKRRREDLLLFFFLLPAAARGQRDRVNLRTAGQKIQRSLKKLQKWLMILVLTAELS